MSIIVTCSNGIYVAEYPRAKIAVKGYAEPTLIV